MDTAPYPTKIEYPNTCSLLETNKNLSFLQKLPIASVV